MATVDTPITGTPSIIEDTPITVTEAALSRVRSLIEEKQLEGAALRVFVSGGGCSGMQYGMGLEPEPRETDYRFSNEGVDVVVDPMSMTYLAGSTIDYVDDMMAGGFKIENPNAVSSCGCGHSFRTEGSSDPHAHDCGC